MVIGLFSGDLDGKEGALEARLPNSTATLVKEVLSGNRNVGLTFLTTIYTEKKDRKNQQTGTGHAKGSMSPRTILFYCSKGAWFRVIYRCALWRCGRWLPESQILGRSTLTVPRVPQPIAGLRMQPPEAPPPFILANVCVFFGCKGLPSPSKCVFCRLHLWGHYPLQARYNVLQRIAGRRCRPNKAAQCARRKRNKYMML